MKDKLILAGGTAGLLLLLLNALVFRTGTLCLSATGQAACDRMEEITGIVSESHRLIGPEISDITTTLGDEAAKRTSLNPAFAALLVRLLKEAGVNEGDTIAAACSGSFPGLLIAILSAAESMKLYPALILSLGSSSYGASSPDFTILDLHMLLYRKGLTAHLPLAVSLGGDRDTGRDMEAHTREMLEAKVRDYNIYLIMEDDLQENIRMRESLYFSGGSGSIKAFINAGGGFASMGTSSLALSLKPGLVTRARMPADSEKGLIHTMLERDVALIHLLYIKGLALQYHIPWDE